MINRLRSAWIPLVAGGLLSSACAPTQHGASTSGENADRQSSAPLRVGADQPVSMTQQIIVKFRDPKFDPSRAEFTQRLSAEVGARLSHVRAMSGDAHVFRVEGVLDQAALEQLMRRLTERADVEYAEPDAIMQHQGGTAGNAR